MSRFNFFRRQSQVPVQPTAELPDDLVDLDISTAVFLPGSSGEYTAAAFDDLRMNAHRALDRFQKAYRTSLQTLAKAQSDKHILTDELEAAQTKNEFLKLQLSEMAERAMDQERYMTTLHEELAIVRSTRYKPEEANRRSIRLVTHADTGSPDLAPQMTQPQSRRNRHSGASSMNESMAESVASSIDSVFSEVSPGSCSPTTTTSGSPIHKSVPMHRPSPMDSPPSRIVQGPATVTECQKCHGVRATEAWDVVTMMEWRSSKAHRRTHWTS